jgi:HEAT repeat protein
VIVIDDREEALARALRRYGKAAIPSLIGLLASTQPETRKMAAYTLNDIDGLAPTDLPLLLRALDAGERRVAPAVATIGTPEAIAALYSALKTRPQDWQLPFAFKRLGRKSVPTLMAAFNCRDGASNPVDPFVRVSCDPTLLKAIACIFEELGPDGSDAVPRLCQIARDKRLTVLLRLVAIKALGAIGPSAASTAPALQEIARRDRATFGEPVEVALFGMKVPAAGKILAAKLTRAPDDEFPLLLRDLAELGAGCQPAAKQVLALLGNPDWEVRVAAARALGYFGDRRAMEPLVGALDNVEDWQLSYVTAESLGRLADARADGALAALERDHWYPPVRESARKARAAIAGRESYVSQWHPSNFAFEFFDFQHAGRDVKPCHPGDRSARSVFLPDDDLRRALAEKMTYDSIVVGYVGGPGGRPERHETPRKQVPNAALQVPDGWLLGGDRGEWGGELVFLDRGGRQTTLVDGNIDGVARLGTRIVAVGGLAHLTSNRGLAYEVARDAKGRWSARPWRVLPGAPWGSARRLDGSWLLDTNGGTVVLAPDGALTMATCVRR